MGVMRGFVVIVYIVAFCIALWQVSMVWQLIEYAGAYAESTVFFSLLVAFCGVLISIFVYIDGEEIDRLREFTGLAKHEKEEMKSRISLEGYAKRVLTLKEQPLCESCAFFGKTGLCQLREKNPKAIACIHYQKKN